MGPGIIATEIDRILSSRKDPERKVQMLAELSGVIERAGDKNLLVRVFVERCDQQRQGLLDAKKCIEELRQTMEKATAPPLHPATFWGAVPGNGGVCAEVVRGNTRSVVALADGVDPAAFRFGDEVLLNSMSNLLVGAHAGRKPRGGATARFARLLDDGRVVLEWRDEEIVVDAGPELDGALLKPGDVVRFDSSAGLAHEVIRRSEGKEYFIEETPSETFAQIGGLGPQIEELLEAVELMTGADPIARKYGLRPVRGILLYGPTGVGKTLLARALANHLARTSPGNSVPFMYVKPSQDNSYLWSQSERNIRRRFAAAREAAQRAGGAPVVMFFDEIDAMGAARGERLRQVNDRVLQAFLAELQGFEDRVRVIVIGATNRPDALDPALLRPGRLGDLILEVPRPGRHGTREIFGKYLTEDIAVDAGPNADDPRAAVIEDAVSAIFAANGGSEIATLRLRDGSPRTVRRSDMVNGAVIANIVNKACKAAWRRERQGGAAGVRARDVLGAISDEFDALAAILTPANCRNHLSGLPWDLDVVEVARARRRVGRPFKYLRVGVA